MWVACSPINYSHTPSLSSILLLISLDVGLLWMSSGDDIGITLVSVYILYDFADTSVALGQWFRTSLFLIIHPLERSEFGGAELVEK